MDNNIISRVRYIYPSKKIKLIRGQNIWFDLYHGWNYPKVASLHLKEVYCFIVFISETYLFKF